MPMENVAVGFIKARISIGNHPDLTGTAKFTLRNLGTDKTFEQSVNVNTGYSIPAAPGRYALYATLGSITVPASAVVELKNGQTTEEIIFNFGQ